MSIMRLQRPALFPECELTDCEAAWRLFSTDTRSAVEEKAARYRSQGFGSDVAGPMRTGAFEPTNLYCRSMYHRYDPSSVRLVIVVGDHARVSVREGVPAGFHVPGFWPTKTEYPDREMWLGRESDGWKVDRTHWPGVA
jgi:hypothetical protein